MTKLYFKYGAMNSGKTTFLLQAAHNYEERGMKVIILKPKIDSKGEDCVISRIGIQRKVDYLISKEDNLYSLIKKHLKKETINCVFVDEVQFLEERQIDELLQVVTAFDIPVMCYGLRTDFKTKGFEASTRLLQVAHSIEEMKTICPCGKKAIFNSRKVNGKFTFEGSQVVIDDNATIEYISLCPKCYFQKLAKYQKLKKSCVKED